jgi:hypothetical protein
MGNGGGDVLVRQKKRLDASEQSIERSAKSRKVVLDRGNRNSATPVAGHYSLRGATHDVDAMKELRAEPEPAGRTKRDRCAKRPGESRDDLSQDFV